MIPQPDIYRSIRSSCDKLGFSTELTALRNVRKTHFEVQRRNVSIFLGLPL